MRQHFRGNLIQHLQARLSVFAAQMLDDAWADCCAHGASVTAMTAEARHAFRKDLKVMRYLSEFFVALFPDLGQDPFRVDFRDIQDALGALNDWQVALTLEGRDNAAMLPDRLTHAMAEAEAIWGRLGRMPLPWRRAAS